MITFVLTTLNIVDRCEIAFPVYARNYGIIDGGVENGGQGRNRTGVDGFAGRSITTLPPGLGEEFPSMRSEARYSTIRWVTMLCAKS